MMLSALIIALLCWTGQAPAGETIEYRLLATNRTSTMEKEINREGQAGFEFLGVTVAQTSFGGREVVSILWRKTSK